MEAAELYDEMARDYDEIYGEEQVKKYVSLAKVAPNALSGKLLDAGCGTLLLAEFLASLGSIAGIGYYVGLDLSLEMLEVARAKVEGLEALFSRADLVRGSVCALPFREGSFSSAVAVTVLSSRLLSSVHDVLRELARCSKGPVVVSVLDKPECAELIKLLERRCKSSWKGGADRFFLCERV